MKKEGSPPITGLQTYHNYVRPHMALDNQTAAEKAGITVKGRDKWITVLQNASHNEPQE